MTVMEFLAPYNVLIVDDAEAESDFGKNIKDLLEIQGCTVKLVIDSIDASKEMEKNYYDILIVDINLGSGKEQDGFMLQKTIRNSGKVQPIIMVTGQPDELERPIKHYVNMFASGATLFYEKNPGQEKRFMPIFIEAVKHIDPIRRALFLLKMNGYKDKPLKVGEKEYSIDDLLVDKGNNEEIIRQLREALYHLFIEMWRNGDLR